jgi:hypothetical protein
MANYTSNLMRRQQAQAPLNTEAIGFVLQSKENKWNANQAKIDEKLSQLGSIQLERDEDKEYLVNNVEKLLGSISNAGRLDYSSDSVARGLDMALTSSIDDYIINQVGIAKKISSFKSGVQELAKKDPNSYNSGNYQYALEKAGIDAYMNKETDDIKNLNYTPYVNVNEELTKRLKDSVIIKGGKRIVQTRDLDGKLTGVPGTIVETTIDGLTQQEIASMLPTFVDSKMQKQLDIDGYFSYNGDNEIAQASLQTYSSKVLDGIDLEINNLKSSIKAETDDPSTLQAKKVKLENAITYRDEVSKQLDTMSNLPADKIGGFMKKMETVASLSNALKGYESKTYIKDNAYFSNLEMKAKEREASTKTREKQKQIAPMLPDAISIPLTSDYLEIINPYDEVKRAANELRDNITLKTNQHYNALSEEDKKSVNERIKTKEYEGLTEIDARSRALRDLNVIDYDKIGELNTLEREYKNYLEDDQVIYESNLTSVFNNPKTYEVLKSNEGMTLVNEKGQKVSYNQYFKDNGIDSETKYTQFMNDPVRSKTIKTKASADLLLSSDVRSDFSAISSNLGNVLNGAEAGNIDDAILMSFDRVSKTTGENKEFLDIFKVTKRENRPTPNVLGIPTFETVDVEEVSMAYIIEHKNDFKEKYKIELRDSAKSTETYKVILESLKNETYDKNGALGDFSLDNSISDDATTRAIFSFDNFQEDYKKQVGERGIRVKGYNQILVTPSSGEANKKPIFEGIRTALASGVPINQDMAESLGVTEPLIKLEDKVALNIMRLPSDTNSFIIKQGNKASLITKEAMNRVPALYNQIELEEKETNLIIDGGKPIEIKKGQLSYKPDSVKTYTYLESKYGLASTAYLASTPRGAKDMIQRVNPSIFITPELKPYGDTLKKAVDNFSQFSVKVQETGGKNYVEVYYDGEKISEVASGQTKGSIVDMVDYDPQIFVTLALTNIATELDNEYTDNFIKLYKKINGTK